MDENSENTIEFGRRGERAVRTYLEGRGYQILETNWHCSAGEADIIAYEDDELVFIEVKTRMNLVAGFPEDSVGRAKRRRYENIALTYLSTHNLSSGRIRFDVIALVVVDEGHAALRHHRDAFASGE